MTDKQYHALTDRTNEPSDAELVQQTRTGSDQAAFAALYSRYLPSVYRYLYARTGDVGLAEDLTSQTFVAVLEGLPSYRERGSFAGWLFTIAARRLADHLRRRSPLLLDETADLSAADPPPETAAEDAAQRARLMHTLHTLSPDRMQAVSLHFFGDLSLQETARVMKRSRTAVKSLIHRGLCDLRERLDDER